MMTSSIVVERLGERLGERVGRAEGASSWDGFVADERQAEDAVDRRFQALFAAASLAVVVPESPNHNRFYATFYSRWLADLKLVELALALPLERQQVDWLRDYRDLLMVALHHGDAMAHTGWCQASVRRFLCRIRESHDQGISDFIRDNPIAGLHAAELVKVANVLRLFRSIPPARSLAEGLGLRVVMTPVHC